MKKSMILELAASEECYMERINISENTEILSVFRSYAKCLKNSVKI